jgi:hypothetical protein
MDYKLYKGSVILSFDEGKHLYTVDGESVLSVTGVAAPKPGLVYWAAKVAAEHFRDRVQPGKSLDEIEIQEIFDGAKKAHAAISKKAASIGSLAHAACETFARTGVEDYPVNPQARASFETFLGWWKDHKVRVNRAEQKVYSVTHRYAGTADLFCEVDGVPCVVDLKTSGAIYDDYLMQLAAYAHAMNEELGDSSMYADGWIVRLPKDGGPVETRHCDEQGLEKAFEAFLGLLTYYRWSKS